MLQLVGVSNPALPPSLSELSRLVAAIAREAGEMALADFRPGEPTRARVWSKAGGSPVTAADVTVDTFLKIRLSELLPEAGWLSEETVDEPARLHRRHVWVVDPIDGTRAFMSGDPDWAVCVALLSEGAPVLGLVHAPAHAATYQATAASGAELNGAPIQATTLSGLAGARVAGPKPMLDALARHAPILPQPKVPSLALRIARIAEGRLDAGSSRRIRAIGIWRRRISSCGRPAGSCARWREARRATTAIFRCMACCMPRAMRLSRRWARRSAPGAIRPRACSGSASAATAATLFSPRQPGRIGLLRRIIQFPSMDHAMSERPENHAPQLLHLVFGGELTDLESVTFRDLSKLDIVGIFPNYATAQAAWKAKAQARSIRRRRAILSSICIACWTPHREILKRTRHTPMADAPQRYPLTQEIAGRALAFYLRAVRAMTRFAYEPADIYDRVRPELPVIYAMWHGQHIMIPFARPEWMASCSLASRHGDGGINAVALRELGIGVIRGSGALGRKVREKGGASAFMAMVKRMAGGESMVLTADVPKARARLRRGHHQAGAGLGPAHPPVAVVTRWRIDVKSWDRMSIGLPIPFNRGAIVVGAPILVAREADQAAVEAARTALEASLDDIHARAYAMIGGQDPGRALGPANRAMAAPAVPT